MRSRTIRPPDPILLLTLALLVVGGVFIFMSASLGLLAYDSQGFTSAAESQFVLGLGGGLIAFFIALRIPYRFWRRVSLYIFIASLLLTLLVFIPHVGLTINGARRWIGIGPIQVQPSEFLKVAYILYLATWFSAAKSHLHEFKNGLIPFIVVTGLTGGVLILQPDTSTFLVTAAAGGAMFFTAGARWKDVLILLLIAVVALGGLFLVRPYMLERVTTFLHPHNDPQGSSYQVDQSLLAVGAGELTGRGFGQSIQKFGKLPEPISDSIFSVFSEEFGFIGAAILVITYLTFALRGFWIAARSPDLFGGLLAVGIVTLIIAQSFFNISAMLALLPLSGLPLEFVSHGGTALLVALGATGILLSVSRSVRA